jgi:outer membrane protein assembly factor BamB
MMTHRSTTLRTSFHVTACLLVAHLGGLGCKSDDDKSPTKPKPTGTDTKDASEDMKPSTMTDDEDDTDPRADWAMMGYDPGSTYFNMAEKKITRQNAANLEVAYTVDMGANVYGAPLQVGDRIYANTQSNVRALNAATGEEIWNVTLMAGRTSGSMSYADGILYINVTGSKIVALNASDGSEAWTSSYQASAADGTSSPLVAGDFVVVGGSNGGIELGGGMFRGFLSAVDRKTGEMKWSTFTTPEGTKGASIWSSPSADIAAGVVYAGTGNNYGPPASDSSDCIIQFDLKTGTVNYKYQGTKDDAFSLSGGGPDYDFGANPVLYETLVDGTMTKLAAAGDKGGIAHAIRRENGEELWRRTLGTGAADGSSGIFTNSTWTGKAMLFALNQTDKTAMTAKATLFALDGATGDVKWMRELQGLVWGRTAVANGVGFVGTGTNLEVFDVETGELIKSFPSGGGTIASTITVAHGRVAFGEGLTWSSAVAGTKLTVLSLK